MGRGLGSSAAFCNGAIECYNTAFKLGLSKMDVARLAYNAESKIYDSKCGQMDLAINV